MAAALLFECATCQKSGFLSSQVRVHVVAGRELNQCRECYVGLECNGKDVADTRWRNTVGRSKIFAYFVNKTTKALRNNGGSGEHAALRRFYVDNKTFIMSNGKQFFLGTWIRAVQERQTAPRAAEPLQMLKEMNE
eukprot:4990434-Karenia_brevis.AAC.1